MFDQSSSPVEELFSFLYLCSMSKSIFYSFLIASLWISCNSSRQASSDNKSGVPIQTPDNTEYILSAIVTFHEINGSVDVKDYQLILKPGKLKDKTLILDEIAQGFKCEFRDKNDQILHTQYIENPLNQRMETTDEQGRLISTDVKFEEQSEMIRVNFRNDMTQLSITEINIGKNPRLIKSIPLVKND